MNQAMLTEMVDYYKLFCAIHRERELDYYSKEKNNSDLKMAIDKAAMFLDYNERKHAHQTRVRHSAMHGFRNFLLDLNFYDISDFGFFVVSCGI